MNTMERVLRLMAQKKASDVYLSAEAPILMRVDGECVPVNPQPLPEGGPRRLLSDILTPAQLDAFDRDGELNVGFALEGAGNFRVSVLRQRGTCAAVIRHIAAEVPPLASLGVPPLLGELVMQRRGLMLMVGSTGSGKTTTLASMIDHRNARAAGHILTIEDPIEYVHRHQRSVVNQREVGPDTESLHLALRNALRQAPDVILIGEIRDQATMSAAIAYAQSGHLCLATLHANNSYHALNRILSFYPVEVRPTLLGDLAAALRAIVSQRLLRTVAGGRVPAVEVMLNTALVSELIAKADFPGVREAMEKSLAEGSQTFEQDLARLVLQGVVARDEALAHADSANNLLWRLGNDFEGKAAAARHAMPDADDEPEFTEITLDVRPS